MTQRDYIDVSGKQRIVARCEKCKREFLTLPQEPLTDRYAPAKWSGVQPQADGSCGGVISPVTQ